MLLYLVKHVLVYLVIISLQISTTLNIVCVWRILRFLNMVLRVGIRAGRDKSTRKTGCKRKLLNLLILRTNLTGKHYRSVESYHAYVVSSKRTLENGRGGL
jgi:hypothetical protein